MFHFLNLNIYALKQGYNHTNKANLTTRISKHASEIDVKGHVKLLKLRAGIKISSDH